MTTISANYGTVYGSLALEDHTNPYRLDAFQDDYTLVDFTLGQTIELDLSSEEFDTYLQLINSDTGEIIAENDDFNSSSNSRLSFITEENINYLVRVTSYGSGKVGNYTLTADKPDVDLIIEDAEAIIVTKKYTDDIFYPQIYDPYDPYYPYDNEAYIHLDLSLTVKNLGSETIFVDPDNDDYYYYNSGLTDSVYLSSDEHFDEFEDYLLTNYQHNSNLEAGASYTNKSTASIHKLDLWGREDNYLIFVADSSNYQYEANEDNNTYAIPLDLDLNQTTPDVDLVITDATATVGSYGNYYGETYLDLSWTITNQGTETALGLPDDYDYYHYEPNWYNTVYLSTDEHFDPAEDYYVTELWHYDSLAGGESYTDYSSAYLYDYQLDQTGNNYLIFVADSSNYQYETNEDNNTYAIPLDLTPPDVDLVATNATATVGSYDQYHGGAYLNFSFTVTNQGSDTVNNFYGYNTVYLSSDEHFDYEDYWLSDLTYDYYGISLEAGSSYTSKSYGVYISGEQLNALESGELKLLFVSDSYNSYPETDETNNSLVTSLDNLLSTPIYRFQNHDLPGTYLYLGEEESHKVYSDYPNFAEEGMAFKVASEPHDDLTAMYRFHSTTAPGSYLYVGEEERQSVKQNYSDSFIEEGLSFYVYSVGIGKGTTFYRFRNTNSHLDSSYIYAAGEEAEYIRNHLPVYVEEGAAFEAIL